MAWKDVYGLEKETRAPKRNNTRLKGALCFTGDTEVLTSEGFKEIKDIKIGDYVFSHTGRLNKVTDTGRREAEIWNVYIDKYKIGTTAEHPFLIDGNTWVEVKDLKTNDKTTSPILKLDETITLPKDYAFMLGLYLSDGTARLKYYDHNVTKSKYKIVDNTKVFKGIDIAIDKRFSEVYNNILSKTSFEYDISESSETNNGYIHILGTNDTNLDLINFIYDNGGLNHLDKYTKFISGDVLQWSNKDKLDLIAGFFLGDGSFSLSGNDSLRLNMCNSNKQIIDMIFILLSSMTKNVRYNVSYISGETLKIADNEVHRNKDLYLLTITNKFVDEFVERYPYMTRVKFKTLNNEWNYNYRKRIDSEKDYYLRPIKNIEHSCEIDTVYNISVENDDSYLVTKDLISVHNCKHLYSVIELLNEKRIIDLIARDLNEWCKRQLGIENNGYQDAEGMMQKDFKANQYDYNIEDVYKTLLSRENFKKYQDGTPLEDLGLSDQEMKDIENAIKGMRDRSQFALKSELEKEFEPVKRGRKIKRDDIKLTIGNADDNEEEAK